MKSAIFIISLIFVFSLSGCTDNKKAVKVKEKPEILLGRDCGLDYFPCCNENPPCSFGQKCCADPNDDARNYCAKECTCGAEKEFCCQSEPKCKPGLICFQGNCASCGRKNEPCCNGSQCNSVNLGCLNGQCVECGLPGNPCCDGGKCLGDGKTDASKTECQNNLCQLCGYGGNPACLNQPKCAPNNLLNNNVCYLCGRENQPCCDKNVGAGFDCDPKTGLECKLGFCAKR